jgi:molybdopterin-guanine dinucleotide biosynthesis protein A
VVAPSIFESKNIDKVFIITVDTPFVKIETIKSLISNSEISDITIATTEYEHNLCGIYSKSCLSLINSMIANNNHKIGYLIKNMTSNKIKFFDENEFLNLNKYEEYKKALTLL